MIQLRHSYTTASKLSASGPKSNYNFSHYPSLIVHHPQHRSQQTNLRIFRPLLHNYPSRKIPSRSRPSEAKKNQENHAISARPAKKSPSRLYTARFLLVFNHKVGAFLHLNLKSDGRARAGPREPEITRGQLPPRGAVCQSSPDLHGIL